MSLLKTVYATDEDIALQTPSDFSILCPRDQTLASAGDGVFDPANPWTMLSPSVDFAGRGVQPGHVVQLIGPSNVYRPPGEAFVVDALGPHSVVLRRKGQGSGLGQPPGPANGLIAVEFLISTLGPQIESASYDLNRRYGIDDLIAGRRTCDLYDPREVREAVVLSVLSKRYVDLSRDGNSSNDSFVAKAEHAKEELSELLSRVVIHWGSAVNGSSTETVSSFFSTRLTR
jgi:hypothetical protein